MNHTEKNKSIPKRHIVESFHSIQGEGASIGCEAFFIRFAGCNLSCSWCDSKIASDESIWRNNSKPLNVQSLSIPEKCQRIVFTGGEPLLQPLGEIANEITEQYKKKFTIECETNGTLIPDQLAIDQIDIWNISPKIDYNGNISDTTSFPLKNLKWWVQYAKSAPTNKRITFKFVIANTEQFNSLLSLIKEHDIPLNLIYCMRNGQKRELFLDDPFNLKLIDLCKENGLNYSPRLHILIWDQKTGV